MSGRVLKLGGVLRWVLDAAWYLLLVGGGLAVLGFIVFLTLGGHVKADVPVAFHIQPGASLTGSSRGVTLTDLSGTLRTRASSLSAAAILIFVVVGWGLILFGLWQLRAVIRDSLAGAPFTRVSARRIELIGLTIVAGDLVRAVAYLSGELWARTHVHLSRISFPITFPVQVTVLVAGLLVIVLAEVFRIGYALQQDQDLTI